MLKIAKRETIRIAKGATANAPVQCKIQIKTESLFSL